MINRQTALLHIRRLAAGPALFVAVAVLSGSARADDPVRGSDQAKQPGSYLVGSGGFHRSAPTGPAPAAAAHRTDTAGSRTASSAARHYDTTFRSEATRPSDTFRGDATARSSGASGYRVTSEIRPEGGFRVAGPQGYRPVSGYLHEGEGLRFGDGALRRYETRRGFEDGRHGGGDHFSGDGQETHGNHGHGHRTHGGR